MVESNFGSSFGWALGKLQANNAVRRKGWRDTFVAMCSCVIKIDGDDHQRPVEPYLIIKTAEDRLMAWMPSMDDLLATDWALVEAEVVK